MRAVAFVLLAVMGVAACGGSADVGSVGDRTSAPSAPAAGAPADGGLSIAEAKASDLAGPLMVGGFIVADGESVRLCEVLLESLPPQCGSESLLVEGLDLDAVETQEASGVRWTDHPVPVLGHVEDGTLRVSQAGT